MGVYPGGKNQEDSVKWEQSPIRKLHGSILGLLECFEGWYGSVSGTASEGYFRLMGTKSDKEIHSHRQEESLIYNVALGCAL